MQDVPDVAGTEEGWEVVRCPLCGGADFEPEFTATSRLFGTSADCTLVRCRACSFELTNPQPRGRALESFYSEAEYYTHVPAGTLRDRIRLRLHSLELGTGPVGRGRLALERHTSFSRFARRFGGRAFGFDRGSSLLDFGCGNGSRLEIAKMRGMDVVGVEPDDAARDVAGRVAQVHPTLDRLKASSGDGETPEFDRIMLSHVLEHLTDPVGVMKDLSVLLSHDGRMLVSVPNVDSAQGEWFGHHWIGYDMPRHLWHFSPETLTDLLRRCGLGVTHLETVELDGWAQASRTAAEADGVTIPTAPYATRECEQQLRVTEIVAVAVRRSP